MEKNKAITLLQNAQKLKDEGNELYKVQEQTKALRKFYESYLSIKSCLSSLSLQESLPEVITEHYQQKNLDSDLIQEFLVLKTKVLSNMCAIYTNQKKWEKVIKFGDDLMKENPMNVRLGYRVSRAHFGVENYERAEEILGPLIQVDPSNSDLIQLAKLIKTAKNKSDTKLYSGLAGMFG